MADDEIVDRQKPRDETIRALLLAGRKNLEEWIEFIEIADTEEFRAKAVKLLDDLGKGWNDLQAALDLMEDAHLAPERVAALHASVQKSLLGNMVRLLEKDPGIDELRTLADIYMTLPRPFEDRFASEEEPDEGA